MTAQASDLSQQRNDMPRHQVGEQEIHPLEDIVEYVKCYAREKPETAALICIGIGFVLGWKLKPW